MALTIYSNVVETVLKGEARIDSLDFEGAEKLPSNRELLIYSSISVSIILQR